MLSAITFKSSMYNFNRRERTPSSTPRSPSREERPSRRSSRPRRSDQTSLSMPLELTKTLLKFKEVPLPGPR